MKTFFKAGKPKTRPDPVIEDKPGLYIVLLSIHGLFRGDGLELGRDSDNGGQIKYLIELARALANHPEVERVDLMTRAVIDSKVHPVYAEPEEIIGHQARIIRIPFGPRRYLRKEKLWPYLDEFSDRALQHIRKVGRMPDIIHSHYADAGYCGNHLSSLLGIPLLFTGHSLGRDKLARLLEQGGKPENIDKQYNISQRIEAEEYTLEMAHRVIASTDQEVNEQYRHYDNYEPERMWVIPPGVDLAHFKPPGRRKIQAQIVQDVEQFLKHPERPAILALARPDHRKNVASLVKAYGQNKQLNSQANLVVIVGNRENADNWEKENWRVFDEFLHLIDKYNLYGKIAYPRSHQSIDIPKLYQYAAQSKGVFINPALTEPFGLTLIEAAASGLPIVATQNGGPQEIMRHCNNGLLIDPLDTDAIGQALLSALSDSKRWRKWSTNGIAGSNLHYSWPGHASKYILEIKKLLKTKQGQSNVKRKSRLTLIDRLLVFDVDDTLLGGDQEGLSILLNTIRQSGEKVGLGIVTTRSLESARTTFRQWHIPEPDLLITSGGANIHYGRHNVFDANWSRMIQHRWEPEKCAQFLNKIPGIKALSRSLQSPLKLSYQIDLNIAPRLREIISKMRHQHIHANLIISHGKYLDVLPMRASKGHAVRYVADKWGLLPERILVAGDSGNDEDMLKGDTLGVVVANHEPELNHLKGQPRVYFAKNSHAKGILEGIEHYGFLQSRLQQLEAEYADEQEAVA